MALATRGRSLLLGNSALVVWGEVESSQVDERALNDWWTNEHLPERLSLPGFLRARRYFNRNDSLKATKYLTLYETADVKALTSPEYMEKLNKPTPGTERHVPTLATMRRSCCNIIGSHLRPELIPCGTGLGSTMAMLVLSLPPGQETSSTLCRVIAGSFSKLCQNSIYSMGVNVLEEDAAATEPGSSTQSYINQNLATKQNSQSDVKRWIVFFEFTCANRSPFADIDAEMLSVVAELKATFKQYEAITFQTYDFVCSVRS